MKDAARLLAYLAATVLFAAFAAPPLFWTAQGLAARGVTPFLALYDFESFFHRALLIGAIVFLWPLLRILRIKDWHDLGLDKNSRALRDGAAGFALAALPLLVCGGCLVVFHIYTIRTAMRWHQLGGAIAASAIVPLIEEALFRGLVLGVFVRKGGRASAILLTSALFSIVHFLKAPETASPTVAWYSGFISIANAFHQFNEPMLVAAGFTTLFLIGWILADARLATRSLWLPIGLHAGWIFAAALFSKIARPEVIPLPWIGKNLLVGLLPLAVGLATWSLVRAWLRYVERA